MPSSANTSSPAEPIRILVTGANGFVGRHLIAELINSSAQTSTDTESEEPEQASAPIRIFAAVHTERTSTTSGAPFLSPEIGWIGDNQGDAVAQIEFDIDSPESILNMIKIAQPHQIYHLAGRASAADTDREMMVRTNSEGVRQVLDAASEISPFPRTLLISSGYVYGDVPPDRPAREEDPIGPLWRHGAYVDSKIEMENIARGYRAFAFTARSFAHTGPGQRPTFAIPSFAQQLAKMELGVLPPTLRVGNLEAKRDILDVRDVVRAYRLLMQLAEPGNSYNVASGKAVSIREALDILRKSCTLQTDLTVDPANLRAADIQCSTGDTLRIWALTGWLPRYSLEDTLLDTLNYWRDQVRKELGSKT